MKDKKDTKTILLAKYRAVERSLLEPHDVKQTYFLCGKLRGVAELLDSVAPGEEWLNDADIRIVNAMRLMDGPGGPLANVGGDMRRLIYGNDNMFK